ncbi:MAG: hypothetical protein U0744_20250 [Gemmataceae bacterium]
MELYVIRHAEAYPIGEGGAETDEGRPLTLRGGRTGPQDCGRSEASRHRFRSLPSSPLACVSQTAEILSSVMSDGKQAVDITDGLVPGSKPKKLGERLAEARRRALRRRPYAS